MQALCAALGRPELAAHNLKPEQQRVLKQALQVEFEKRSFDELCELFAGLDACVEPVLTLSEAVAYPQLKARALVSQVPRGDGSSQAQIACPLKFSEGLPAPRHIGVAVGAHSDEVLVELGFSVQRIAELRRSKVLG